MKRVSVISTLLMALVATSAFAGVQPVMDNVYGNSVVLNGGDQNIWNLTFSEQQFVSNAYATDAQVANYITWTQNDGGSCPLKLSDSGNWADGSVTWKFVAPTGKVFSGGVIKVQGMGIWGTCSLELNAYSAYLNNGNGYGGYDPTSVLYGSDKHVPGEWTWSDWTVSVPTNVSEFYVTAASRTDWHTTWASSMNASNVSFASVPEPSSLAFFGFAGASLIGFIKRKRS